jgi:hypothetical protein
MQDVQPSLLAAGDHVRGHARAGEGGWAGNLPTSEGRFHKNFPTLSISELGLVTALPAHRAQVQRPTLRKKLRLGSRPDVKSFQAVANPWALFHVE